MADPRWKRLPLYVGGLMGPFGTSVVLPMFPELRNAFGVSSRAVGWGFTMYLLPFAVLLLVSGTLGERWGRRRTVRVAYLVYACGSLVCAVAPNLATFIVGRATQGMANAFITPLLVAGLAELVAPDRFGRSVGVYSSFQALGGMMAPLVGGVAADVDWRFAFVATALAALALAAAPPPGEPRGGDLRPELGPVLVRPMIVLGVGAFAAAAGPVGVSVLVGVSARDSLQVSGSSAGLILLAGTSTAFVAGPLWGRLLDRWGPRRSGVVAASLLTIVAALMSFATTPVSLAIAWAMTGALVGFVVVVFQTIAASAMPENRGGALSFVLAFRFLGHAVGPILWLAVFESNERGAFLGSAALGIVTIAAMAVAAPIGRGATVSVDVR